MRWLLFSSAGLLVYLGFCFYIGIKLYALICHFNQNFRQLKKIYFWIPFAFFCCVIVLSDFFRINLSAWRTAGLLWMVSSMYLAALFLLTDIIRLILFIAKKEVPGINAYMTAEAVFLCAVLVVFGVLNTRSIHTKHYDLTLNGEGGRLRAALITDMHIGDLIGASSVAKYVEALNAAKPDIVFMAGDIFDRFSLSAEVSAEIISLLKKIEAPMGVFACLGNHDRDTVRITNVLRQAGIYVLQDEVFELRENLFVAGRKDARHAGMTPLRHSARSLLDGLDGTVIVLDHQPTDYALLEKAGADLILSGHTHRGQVFPATIITWFLYKKAGSAHYGYWKGDTAQGVISSGAGFWGPPVRIGTRREIAVINIHFVPN
jgi:predicted MPP superfamily phosphohydrolase